MTQSVTSASSISVFRTRFSRFFCRNLPWFPRNDFCHYGHYNRSYLLNYTLTYFLAVILSQTCRLGVLALTGWTRATVDVWRCSLNRQRSSTPSKHSRCAVRTQEPNSLQLPTSATSHSSSTCSETSACFFFVLPKTEHIGRAGLDMGRVHRKVGHLPPPLDIYPLLPGQRPLPVCRF